MNDSTCGQHPKSHIHLVQDQDLTDAYVRGILDYDRRTGALTWRQRADMRPQWNARFARKRAGWERRDKHARTSYRRIRIDGRNYLEHRIVWLHYYGQWPQGEIDHINGDGTDNRIANLREVDRSANMRNQRKRLDNTSGVNGVYWDTRSAKWHAHIRVNGRRFYLGLFENLEDATRARREAEARFGFSERHGRGE